MKLNVFVLLLIFSVICSSSAQDTSLSNIDVISLEASDSTQKYDFSHLKEILEGKRIILLGEQTHGDGATFDAKVELIKFLHQELGFDIVAFESPMYGIYKANKLSIKHTKEKELLNENVFEIWSDTQQFQQLLDYKTTTTATDHPLIFAGIDFQEWSMFEEQYFEDVKNLFIENEIGLKDSTIEILKETILGGSDFIATSKSDSVNFYNAYSQVMSGFLLCDQKNEDVRILQQTLMSKLAEVEWGADIVNGNEIKVQNPRDIQMAKNMIFLSELYPDKKIIGWGASYHFANEVTKYQNSEITSKAMKKMEVQQNIDHDDILQKEFNLDNQIGGAIPMGQILKDNFGEELYSMAFSSYEGHYGLIGQQNMEVIVPPVGSIEQVVYEKGYDYAFVDFQQLDSGYFYSSPLGYLPILASWKNIFDGLFYIKTAYPPDFIEYEETDLSSFLGQKNIQFNGRVVDAKTKEGVSYAHIAIENTSIGTVSNDGGYFTFNFQNADSISGAILFSSVGYKSLSIRLNNADLIKDSLLIELEAETKVLNEIVISERFLTARQIVKKARKSIEDNYYQLPFDQEVFCRVKQTEEDSMTFLEEASLLTYFDKGYNASAKIFGQILQFRNVTQNLEKDTWSGIGGMWLVYSHDVILAKNNPLYRTGAYDLELTDITKFNNEEVYEITFNNKRPSAYTTGYGYPAPSDSYGKLYISAESYAVLRYEHCVKRKDFEYPKKKPKFRSEKTQYQLIQTFKRYNDRYFIHHTKHVFSNDKVDLKTMEMTHNVKTMDIMSSEIYTQSVQPLERPIGSIKVKMKVEEDPEFWSSHNIILEDEHELDICK